MSRSEHKRENRKPFLHAACCMHAFYLSYASLPFLCPVAGADLGFLLGGGLRGGTMTSEGCGTTSEGGTLILKGGSMTSEGDTLISEDCTFF